MPSIETLCTFALAALLLAAMPGPGLLYIVSRTLALGRKQGFASCLGAAVGGLVHVVAGVVGVSALVMQSATAFAVLKCCGCIYLLALAVQTWRSAAPARLELQQHAGSVARSFQEARIVEATNPKTAAFSRFDPAIHRPSPRQRRLAIPRSGRHVSDTQHGHGRDRGRHREPVACEPHVASWGDSVASQAVGRSVGRARPVGPARQTPGLKRRSPHDVPRRCSASESDGATGFRNSAFSGRNEELIALQSICW